MIRKALRPLLAAALIAASTGAFATPFGHIEARVLDVVPHLSLSFGSLRHDGFNVTYELEGVRRVIHRHERPGRVIYVPQPVRVVHHHRHESRHQRWDDHDRGRRAWREHDDWGRPWDANKRRIERRHDERWDDRGGDDRGRGRGR